MKVICIGELGWVNIGEGFSSDLLEPEKGKIYTVLSEKIVDGLIFYEIQGFDDLYCSESFRKIDVAWVDGLLHYLKQEHIYSSINNLK